MSRRQGQITRRQAFLWGVGAILVLWVVVAGLDHLVRAEDQLPALDAPVEPQHRPDQRVGVPCPDPDDLEAEGGPHDVSTELLLECPGAYDGRRVRFRGEAVRALLDRGDLAWAQLNDDPYALEAGPLPSHRATLGGNSGMPVAVPTAVADQVERLGSYRARGDVLEIVGEFQRTGDAGAPAIMADQGEVVRAGAKITPDVDPVRAVAAGILAAVAGSLALVAWRARRS